MGSKSLAGAALITVSVMAGACSGNPGSAMAERCAQGLAAARGELNTAKINGFGGTVNWSKAASLVTAAKVQYEFERYPNCVDKVQRARAYLARLRR